MAEELQGFPIQLDPQTDTIIGQKIAIPLVYTEPSLAPRVNGTRFIYDDGSVYWVYVYAGGAWRKTGLDGWSIPASPSNGNVVTFNGTTIVWAMPSSFADHYGDGSDGDYTVAVDATQSRDYFYDDITIN